MTREAERRARILRYWRAVEYFSPQRVDPVDPAKGLRKAERGRALPWEPGARAHERLEKKNVWRHTVYAGVFELGKVREVLGAVLRAPDEELDLDSRAGGHSALLSFTVNADGLLIRDSVTVSSCGWAIGRTVDPGPNDDQWLTGFEATQREILGVAFGIGDGRVPIISGGAASSVLGPVAGMLSRVAVESIAGGIATVIGGSGVPLVGAVAAQVVTRVGEEIAGRVGDVVSDAVGGGDDAESEVDQPPLLGAKALTLEDLAALTRWVAERLGVAEALQPNVIRIKSRQVHANHADDAGADEFLNSFYVEDLERVTTAVSEGDVGAALSDYLRDDASIDVRGRVDVRTAPREVLQGLTPDAMPPGRWPAKPAHPLTLSQQFAVNEIYHGLRDPQARGIFAVNGPPGTGKTTLLRDLIAAIVVERAIRLAQLEDPRQAFETTARTWRTAETGGVSYPRRLHPLIGELCGYEMVVASSNNGAVENVTMEVPATKAIDEESFPYAEYLSYHATRLTGVSSWAAIAARLGRRSYRSEFVQRFWWTSGAGSNEPEYGLCDVLEAFRQILMAGEAVEGALTWDEAVAEFEEAMAEVQRLGAERQRIADILERSAESDPQLAQLRGRAADAQAYVAELRLHRDVVVAQVRQAEQQRDTAVAALETACTELRAADGMVAHAAFQVQLAETALREHARQRPGFLKRLLSWEARESWEVESLPYKAAVDAADQRLAETERYQAHRRATIGERQRAVDEVAHAVRAAHARLEACDRELATATLALTSTDRSVRHRENQLRREDQLLTQARERWAETVPGPEWDAAVDDRDAMATREKSSPWMDEEFATARTKVFLAALNLHHAVFTNEPKLVRDNLFCVMDVVSGDAPAELPAETVRAAWQMLFFVVPVISTTFASVSRMFTTLGREALGWLFIDEAGQAAPHEAVGALWRTQRAVVVGDPRQLEPVIVLPWSGQRRLCWQFQVDAQWTPQGSSVQSIADRLNRFGTWLPDPENRGQLWVGAPLRVHRRCDRLMFAVSNEIAYDNLMVYGASGGGEDDLLARNTWLDIPASPSGEKWNPADGRYVLATLNLVRSRIRDRMEKELSELDDELPDWAESEATKAAELKRRVSAAVFIVSPFRDVVHGLQRVIGSRLPRKPKRVGTIHTTQGKEAEIVILVLGTAKDQHGSRDWAAHTPNLLNVAVTRAVRRLVVIGDIRDWAEHRNFQVLARYGRRDRDGLLTIVDTEDWSVHGADGVNWGLYWS
ncbi:AAA domain-containing protein [Nocardia sp. NPDC004860]|uniref:AAA domain-containing protein n=1 Tax=Nocardia sp. NPDC004860 TaxID=3154557 RepID=UPI0033B199FF